MLSVGVAVLSHYVPPWRGQGQLCHYLCTTKLLMGVLYNGVTMVCDTWRQLLSRLVLKQEP